GRPCLRRFRARSPRRARTRPARPLRGRARRARPGSRRARRPPGRRGGDRPRGGGRLRRGRRGGAGPPRQDTLMDLLDRVAVAGRDLLARVDEALLATGAPDGHPIWTALRRVGALPGDAFGTVVALRPEPLSAAAADLRALAESYARLDVRPADEWTGLAADAYAVRWRDLARHLGGSADPGEASLSGRLAATAAYLAEVADWASAARLELARSLGAVLGSAEALRLRT